MRTANNLQYLGLMRKYFGLILSALIVTGCLGGTGSSAETNRGFRAGNAQWKVFIPETWEVIQTPNNNNKVFLAYHLDENLSVVSGLRNPEDELQDVFKNAQNYLSDVDVISEGSDTFRFRARENALAPIREFRQKIIAFDTKKFLLASCSYDINNTENKCGLILNSLQQGS